MSAKQDIKSCASCKHNSEGGCALDAEKICLKSHGWDQNGTYNYVCWEAKADDEVLRCAEEETKLHKVGADASGEVSEVECDCKLCNAVRVAKENRK